MIVYCVTLHLIAYHMICYMALDLRLGHCGAARATALITQSATVLLYHDLGYVDDAQG